MEKLIVNMPIIVEGKYDKIKLESFVDGVIICVNGFRIFKDKQKLALLRKLSAQSGVVLLTDSDVAGFKLRNFIKQAIGNKNIVSIYIPQVSGKEKRKLAPSKEGLLGVEGINVDVLRELFFKAGVLETSPIVIENPITKADFLRDGLIGTDNSSVKRQALLAKLGLPSYMSTKALLDVINRVMSKEQYINFITTFGEE